MDLASVVASQVGFARDDIVCMHDAAVRVLSEIGISVENADARQALVAAGARGEGERIYLEPAFTEECLTAIRDGWAQRPHPRTPGKLSVTVGDMCQYYHNPHNDEIELMSTANVVEATKCVEVMRDKGLGSYVPGVPRDVPQQLQAIVEYRIGSEFATDGPTLDTLHPAEALPYLFQMADAMGRPMKATNIFPVSPLRLSGYEFDVAVRHAARWDRFHVTTYPAVGVTAPVRVRSAWVLSIAEALGGAITLHVIGGGKPVYMSIGMFPFDLRTFTIAGGMPECAWMYWASAQVTRFYNPQAGYSMMLGTQAKRPGLQSGYEKAMAGTLGVLTGCNDLHYVGVMSFDDIFSSEQMVADIELRDALEQLGRGIPEVDPECWIEDIREGVSDGYVQTDTTLNMYRDTYWFPKLLDRTSWHTFNAGTGRTARQRAQEVLLSRLSEYDYSPPSQKIADLRRVFDEAWHRLGGDPKSPVLEILRNS
ncbi:MAG: trimethylamine methyltransferase family protein [Anaerolineae bacterium]|nr:trimethylamine methyltransferase family protein [Anaerolineae bacterium]